MTFLECQATGIRGVELISDYLRTLADGRVVMLDKGKLAPFLQATIGDALMELESGHAYSVEIKTEEKWTGRLFLETWSNKNFEDKKSHAQHGAKVGWLISLRSDGLFYYFEDRDVLCIADMFALQRWAFGGNGFSGAVYRHQEVPQNKHQQLNHTFGRIVPVTVLEHALGASFKLVAGLKNGQPHTITTTSLAPQMELTLGNGDEPA